MITPQNIFQKPIIKWKKEVFYQRFPIRQKNGMKNHDIQINNLFRSLPLKIFRNELGGNSIYEVDAVASSITINNLLEQPAGFIFSKTDHSVLDNKVKQTFVNKKDIIDGNSTNTVGQTCDSFSFPFTDDITLNYRTWDYNCLCDNPYENKTQCLSTSYFNNKVVYNNVVRKTTCLSTQGNALTRVRNRNTFNCGGNSGNIGYRNQYTSTKNINSLVTSINNFRSKKYVSNNNISQK
jgi:hypothetical protein